MHIIYDARHLVHEVSGLSRYTYCLLCGLIDSPTIFTRLEILVRDVAIEQPNTLEAAILHQVSTSAAVDKIQFKPVTAPLFGWKHHLQISRLVNRSSADVYFYPYIDFPLGIKKRSIFVVHDLFPLVMPDYIVKWRKIKTIYYRWIIGHTLLKKNIHCIAVSHSTRADVLRFFPSIPVNRLSAVLEALVSIRGAKTAEIIRPAMRDLGNQVPFLFYVGDRRPHKNLRKMIDIHASLVNLGHPDLKFVIAGSEKNFAFDLESYISNKKGIMILGRLNEAELAFCQEHMSALFFLSKYEGFGLPVLEAAQRGKRIITSSISSLPEVAPPWALLLDQAGAVEDLAKKISVYLKDTICGVDLGWVESRFSWQKAALEVFAPK
jgi:glycosyltransferase involved in cell wall biosynthesis